MKAIVYTHYGTPDVLRLADVPRPVPTADQVLIKIHAAALNAADGYMLRGAPFLARLSFGLRRPRHPILGADIAGRVEAVGANVRGLAPGDAVFGDLSGCGLGGLAEYASVPASVLARKPKNLSFLQAAAVPMAGVTALQALRTHGRVQAGQKVLIQGASGGVGTFAVQLARHFGARVTAVCSSSKAEQARALGAHQVIDYTREDVTQRGERYDLIIAANGYHPLSHYRRILSPAGTYVAVGGAMAQIFQSMLLGPLLAIGGAQRFLSMTAQPNVQDLALLADLLDAGTIVPVLDRCYSLEQAAQALDYLGQRHASGKVVISITQAD